MTTSVTTDDPARSDAPTTGDFDFSELVSFLAAGAVLSGSLILGSSASMVFAGDNVLIGAILEGFLELALWAFGGFLVAVGLAATVARRRS